MSSPRRRPVTHRGHRRQRAWRWTARAWSPAHYPTRTTAPGHTDPITTAETFRGSPAREPPPLPLRAARHEGREGRDSAQVVPKRTVLAHARHEHSRQRRSWPRRRRRDTSWTEPVRQPRPSHAPGARFPAPSRSGRVRCLRFLLGRHAVVEELAGVRQPLRLREQHCVCGKALAAVVPASRRRNRQSYSRRGGQVRIRDFCFRRHGLREARARFATGPMRRRRSCNSRLAGRLREAASNVGGLRTDSYSFSNTSR